MTHQRIRVTKRFTFDMAHALYGYDGPCKNIHGHTYHLSVTLLGIPIEESLNPKQGMVIDFTDFKKIIKTKITDVFDHALVLNANSPHAQIQGLESNFEKIIYSNFQPTCENLLIDFLNRIRTEFPPSLIIHSLRLDETPTSYAEWHAADN
ncbi:MAG: 6-carboxytetrahydropterin synthase [Bacteroidia bacterium]|nr:6-carboxytetrahydropterin synthase [Bacteroidia bacterium]